MEAEIIERTTLQEFATKQIETAKKVYLLSPERMFSEYKGEKENVTNYNGRQLLEMLQNADDAASEARAKKRVIISLQGNQLVIANTGYPFSEDGLNSIFHSHLSPKQAQENQIGKKGLGFRSILSWANKVTIKSHELCVAFSKLYSKEVLDELLLDYGFEKAFEKLNKSDDELPIATLVCPEIIFDDKNSFANYTEFDTVILIDLKEKAHKDVLDQIEKDLDGEVLIFLNNIELVEINIEGIIKKYEKKYISKIGSIARVKIVSTENEMATERIWNVNSISGFFQEHKSYELSLAWKDELDQRKDVIYSYFRTKVKFYFPGILHGTFELNADRSDIVDDEDGYNSRLAELIPTLIADTSERIAQKETIVNYKALSIVFFDNNTLPAIIQETDFINKLRTEILTKKILPTISNRYLSFNDTPVYYKDENFANLLPANNFPLILSNCQDIRIGDFLNSTIKTKYLFKGFCDIITSKRKDYSISQYASLVIAIMQNVTFDTSDVDKLSLFYDSEFKPLSFGQPIFLPSSTIKTKLPGEIGVQVINEDLAEELRKLLGALSYETLAEKLSYYKIKIFNFSEVVEILISHYFNEKANNDSIKELNKHIFFLYSNEKPPYQSWYGKAIPLISKNRKIEIGKKLYFGKEYDCSITQSIYSYDDHKLLNSPKYFGIGDLDLKMWKSYLKWAGVAELPRKILIDGSSEFAEYSMRQFDFKNQQIDNSRFKNFDEFKGGLYGYPSVKVVTIDDLDAILKNNSSEKILAWINSDNELLRSIEDDKEPSYYNSKIMFNFAYAHKYREITGNKIRSYLKWKISNTIWLTTKNGLKQSPNLCTTSSTITEEFSPLIEKPNINPEHKILRENNINNDKIIQLLHAIGVNKTISSFETKTLYSILLKLPEIDKEGKKAKTLYHELATNYEEKNLDTSVAEYIAFKDKGQVFCKKDGKYWYQKINGAFYVGNKSYGESIINRFYTIDIVRRKSQDKIEKVFGVKPLRGLQINLANDPILHELNGKFEQEIENFKPYVYVFRQDFDQRNTERNLIKEIRIKLVTDLVALLKADDENIRFDLSYYDYLYLPTAKTIYISTPPDIHEERQLKDDVIFCSTVAEAFSALIDVDAQSSKIRELFSKNAVNRDQIIQYDLDDPNLNKLLKAKEALGIVNDPKIQFWRNFIRCFSTKKIKNQKFTEENLLEELMSLFLTAKDLISKLFNEINYDNYNEEQSLRLIIDLLRATGKSIGEVNKFANPSIDISEIYEIDFKRIKDEKKIVFKKCLYSDLVVSRGNKLEFLKTLSKYDSTKLKCKNELNYDVLQDLVDKIKETFQIDMNDDIENINFEEILLKNKTAYLINAENESISIDIAKQFLEENPSFESLLYFDDEINHLLSELKNWAPKPNDDSSKSKGSAKRKITIGTTPIFYNDYSDLFLQLEGDLNGSKGFQINLSKIKIKRTEVKRDSGNTKTKTNFPKTPKQKEDLGFLGEYVVYKHLRETIKNTNSVKWVSEYAKAAGVISDIVPGIGYDLEYIPNGFTYPKYVEVKVVGSENAFHISSNEINQGEKLKRHYEIFLVRNITDPENTSIEIIQGPFDYKGQNSFTDNELFTVINDSFILKFEKFDE